MSEYLKVAGRKNSFTYTFQGKYLYSVYDPIKEASSFLEKNCKATSNVAISICGADFANQILLQKNYKIIINVDLGLILSGHSDFEPTINDARIKRVVSIKQAGDILLANDVSASQIDVLAWTPYVATHSDCGPILNKIKEICQTATASKITAETFGKVESRNAKRNLATIKQKEFLKRCSYNKPAIIVASGGSLPCYESLLRVATDKALIVALPSAMKYLENKKIKVDYCIVTDPGYASLYHLNNLQNDTKLICPLSVNPTILRLPHIQPVFFDYGNQSDEGIFDKQCVKSVSEGSVCFNALRIVKQLGCTKAILLGQDFAFYQHRSHVKGGFFETEYYNTTNYFNSLDKILAEIQLRKQSCIINVGEKKLDSDISLKIYYQHLLDTEFDIEILLPSNVYNPLDEARFKKIDESFFVDRDG